MCFHPSNVLNDFHLLVWTTIITSFQVNGIKHNLCWRKQTCNKLPNNDQNYQN